MHPRRPPEVGAAIKPGQHLFACLLAVTNYRAGARRSQIPVMFIMNDEDVWDGGGLGAAAAC
jgi:hypothetical protein